MAALPHAVAPSAVLADIKSVADCDATLDALTVFIAQAERQLTTVRRRSSNESAGWRASLTAELRIAKLTLPRLQERRADLKREERQRRHLGAQQVLERTAGERRSAALLYLAQQTEPEAMRRVEALARERDPDLFGAGEAA